jgi:hypothetical protein
MLNKPSIQKKKKKLENGDSTCDTNALVADPSAENVVMAGIHSFRASFFLVITVAVGRRFRMVERQAWAEHGIPSITLCQWCCQMAAIINPTIRLL